MGEKAINVKIQVDSTDIDEAEKKAEKLKTLLVEVNKLIRDLKGC